MTIEQQVNNLIAWLKVQPIEGCITGSCLLEINPEWNQDVDLFVFNEKSLNKILFAMHHNPIFQILDKIEKWKFNSWMNDNSFQTKNNKFGLTTIKFTYNTCIDVNIILKKNSENVFSVLSSFDMNIICKAYDIQTKQYLDLTEEAGITKIASWNKWNPNFYKSDIWETNRLLRQLERCFKYYKRGYNTDDVVVKYISLIDELQEYQNIFNSVNFDERLKTIKENTEIVKKICLLWLETHSISDEQLELLKTKIKEI
jgi:hypothetical protein